MDPGDGDKHTAWVAAWHIGIVGFNVPLDTFIRHFGDDFTRQMTQPTVQ